VRKLVAICQMTLDGVMQAPGGPEEDPTGGFELGGWSVNYWDDAMLEMVGEAFGKEFELVLGRRTYEIFAAHWPYDEGPIADGINAARKHVASRTLSELEWENSVLLEGDVSKAIATLKAEDGPELQTQGSIDLLQTLLADGLVDEFRVFVFPVVVGPGKRLFGDSVEPAGLELVESRTSGTGVFMGTYRVTGPIEPGSFAFEEPTEREVERRERLSG
jgi:dihydrofolate reductase